MKVTVMVPVEEWAQVKAAKIQILEVLRIMETQRNEPTLKVKNITAMEFMAPPKPHRFLEPVRFNARPRE